MYQAIKAAVGEWFAADPDTGVVTLARATNRCPAGAAVGHPMVNGYLAVMVPGLRVKAYVHHVVYFLCTGVWPPETGRMMDHADRDRKNNRLANLRLVTAAENAANHGQLGVRPYTTRGGVRFRAEWRHAGATTCRAGFLTEDAALAWLRESRADGLPQLFGKVSSPQVHVAG